MSDLVDFKKSKQKREDVVNSALEEWRRDAATQHENLFNFLAAVGSVIFGLLIVYVMLQVMAKI